MVTKVALRSTVYKTESIGVKTLPSSPPKVAKCTFERFGPTGTIEVFDGLCVLPINIINEKIYIFLWFWFVLLGWNSIELFMVLTFQDTFIKPA